MIHQSVDIHKKTYFKISKEKHQMLINMVFKFRSKIKDAAKALKLNYATAKNIIRRFRKNHICKTIQYGPENRRCSYKQINNEHHHIRILGLSGGEPIN